MRRLLLALLFSAMPLHAATYYVTVAGLGGEPDYEQRFTTQANGPRQGLQGNRTRCACLHTVRCAGQCGAVEAGQMATVAQQATPSDDFVLILIGHGSYDGTEYKFNLVGPDLTAAEIAALCDKVAAKRQLIVDTTSSSGGAVPAFERNGRAVVAATKSGTEKNATVFARYFVEALQDPSADIDKNEAVTAMEAYTYAAKKTAAFYDSQKRLATEHAVFDRHRSR